MGKRRIEDDGKLKEPKSSGQMLVCYVALCKASILQNWYVTIGYWQ